MYRLDTNVNLEKDKELITSEFERIAQLIVDLNIGMGCIDSTPVPYNYTAEFDFKGVSGGIRWINKKVFKAKMDYNVRHNFDLDLIMQELLVNRIILKPKYLTSICGIDTNKGGGSGKKRKDQLDSITNMKLKWGKYFEFDHKKNVPKIMVKR